MEYLDSIKSLEMKLKIAKGEIKINTKDDFVLPITQSIPLDMKGSGFFKKFKAWLIDIQDEVFIEDYYFFKMSSPFSAFIKTSFYC